MKIRRLRVHPFILARVGGEDARDRRFITCRTPNEAGEFVQDLLKLAHFAHSKLVRAIERADQRRALPRPGAKKPGPSFQD